jgi:preprotein translocase SecF subunit
MFRLVERRRIFFTISGLILILGIATFIYSTSTTGSPLQLGVDFTGGAVFDLQFEDGVSETELRDFFAEIGAQEVVVQKLVPLEQAADAEAAAFPDNSRWSVRTEELDEVTDDSTDVILDRLSAEVAPLNTEATTTEEVSGTIGQEVTQAALLATAATTIFVMGFIWLAFRKVPNAGRYGAAAIVAMLHDILIVATVMSIMGMLFDWRADSLFLTAMLTVLGYSVQDTIVIFDRIRENLVRRRGESFELIVNRSVLETIHRSLATQLNAIFIMVALVLFGGETIRQFMVIMLIGLTTGTYSSIFIAVPFLVAWERGEIPFVNQEAKERNRAAKATA